MNREASMTNWKCLLLCSLLGSASMPAAACFTVYDHTDRIVYHGATPPVDMSKPLHETLPALVPGGHMIFGAGTDCPALVEPPRTAARTGASSPLLTDQRTAQAMGLPHTVLADGVALVQAQDAATYPGFAVLPSVALAARRPSRETVITELRDPPVTIVQSGDRVSVEQGTRAMGAGPGR
jgi:hypothetical protein